MADDVIKASIVFDMRAIKRAARGFGDGPARVARGVSKSDKNISSMSKGVGKMAAGFAAGMAVFEGIKSLMGKFVASSPQLQASIDVLKKSFEFMLRPIGDAIGGALRPFALAWLRFGLKWYKDVGPKMEKWFGDLIDNTGEFAKGFLGEEGIFGGDIGAFLKDLFVDAVPAAFVETWESLKDTLGALWKFLTVDMLPVWQILGSILGIVIIGALKLVKFNLELLQRGLEFIGPIIGTVASWLGEQLTPVFEAMPGIIDAVIGKMTAISDTLWNFFTKTIPDIFTNMGSLIQGTIEGIKELAVGTWQGLKIEAGIFWEALKFTITEAWDDIKTAIIGVIDAILEKLRNIPVIGGAFGGGGDNGGPVTQDFIIRGNKAMRFSPQDTVMGFKGNGPQGGGVSLSVEVNINALDASSIDDNVIRKITEAIDNAQRRGILSRTLQATGS